MSLDFSRNNSNAKDEIIKDAIENILPDDDIFTTISGRKAFSDEYDLKVAANKRGEMSLSLVQLAFQYIAKVLTAVYCNDENLNPIENSPAHKGIRNLKWKLSKEYYSELKERFEYAEMRILDYIDNGNDSVYNLVQHCWFLAKLDVCYKKGAVPSDIGQFFVPAYDEEVTEIRNLAVYFKRKFLPEVLTPTSTVVFNPEFGFGERLIGESDCHMIIDRSIIDLRADFFCEYPVYRVARNLKYYLMTMLNREFNINKGNYRIDNLIFYSGRFGETEILSLDIIEDDIYIALDKVILATEAKYRVKEYDNFYSDEKSLNSEIPEEPEGFLDDYQDREYRDYDDGYNQVVKNKHHYFRNIMLFIIFVSLTIVAFVYAKDWYVSNYGEDFALDHIINNIFG